MRPIAAAAVAAALSLTLQAQTTTTHRATTTTHRKPAATATTAAAPQEGTAAVGTMPAVTGQVKTLFTLRYVDLVPGTGELAQTHKWYTVHYTGWTTDGKKFDSSFDHDGKEPISIPIGARPAQVIIGWDTGFEGMRVGGKRRLIIPYQLAYGELGRPPVIPAKSDLIFDVELLAQSDTRPGQQPAASPQPATPPPAAPAQKPAAQPGTNPVTNPETKPATKPE